MFSTNRPVGNRVKYFPAHFNSNIFKPYVFHGFESGTAALAQALLLVKSNRSEIEKPEVILPAYTCPDVISACEFAKVKPVLVDFSEDSPWMDIEKLRQKISPSTISIIAINFLGIPERIGLINSILDKEEVMVIEDSAQGLPVDSPSHYWQADIVITSFGRGKPLNLLNGGAILLKTDNHFKIHYDNSTNKAADTSFSGKILYRLKIMAFNFLSKPFPYYFLSRISFLKIGETIYTPLSDIKQLPQIILKQIKSNYEEFKNRKQPNHNYIKLFQQLKSSQIIVLPSNCKWPTNQPLLRFPILVKDRNLRENIFRELQEKDLGASKLYQTTLEKIPGVSSICNSKEYFPNAESFSKQIITLPTHEGVSDKVFSQIETILKRNLGKHSF